MVSTVQMADLEALKEIPGYTAILRAVLKSLIQGLVTQLSERAGEEAVVLTASVTDGTLGHLSSHHADDFLTGRDEIKAQFLTHCIKRHHTHTTEYPNTQSVGKRPRDDTHETIIPTDHFSPSFNTIAENTTTQWSDVTTRPKSSGRKKSRGFDQAMASQSWSSSPVEYQASPQAETSFDIQDAYARHGEYTPILSVSDKPENRTKRKKSSLQLANKTGSVSSELGQMGESFESETQSGSVFLVKQEVDTVTQSDSIFSQSGSSATVNQKTDAQSADSVLNQSGSLLGVGQEADTQPSDSVLVLKQEPDGHDDDVTVVSMEPAVSQGMFESQEPGLAEMQAFNKAMLGTNGSPGEPVQFMSHAARLKTMGELPGTDRLAGSVDRNGTPYLPKTVQTDLSTADRNGPPHLFPTTVQTDLGTADRNGPPCLPQTVQVVDRNGQTPVHPIHKIEDRNGPPRIPKTAVQAVDTCSQPRVHPNCQAADKNGQPCISPTDQTDLSTVNRNSPAGFPSPVQTVNRNGPAHVPSAFETDLCRAITGLPSSNSQTGQGNNGIFSNSGLSHSDSHTALGTKGFADKRRLFDSEYTKLERIRSCIGDTGSNSSKPGAVKASGRDTSVLGTPVSEISGLDSSVMNLSIIKHSAISNSGQHSSAASVGDPSCGLRLPINKGCLNSSSGSDPRLFGTPTSATSGSESTLLGSPVNKQSSNSPSGADSTLLGTGISAIFRTDSNMLKLPVNPPFANLNSNSISGPDSSLFGFPVNKLSSNSTPNTCTTSGTDSSVLGYGLPVNKRFLSANSRSVPVPGSDLRRRFPCDQCNRAFSQRCDLRRHMSVHTGERFHCSVCPKSFSQKHQRNLHQLTHTVAQI